MIYLTLWLLTGLAVATLTHRFRRDDDPLPVAWWVVLTVLGPLPVVAMIGALIWLSLVGAVTEHAQERHDGLGSEMDQGKVRWVP